LPYAGGFTPFRGMARVLSLSDGRFLSPFGGGSFPFSPSGGGRGRKGKSYRRRRFAISVARPMAEKPAGFKLLITPNEAQRLGVKAKTNFPQPAGLNRCGNKGDSVQPCGLCEWSDCLTPNRLRFIGGYLYSVLRTVSPRKYPPPAPSRGGDGLSTLQKPYRVLRTHVCLAQYTCALHEVRGKQYKYLPKAPLVEKRIPLIPLLSANKGIRENIKWGSPIATKGAFKTTSNLKLFFN